MIETQEKHQNVRQSFWNARAKVVIMASNENSTVEAFVKQVQKLNEELGIDVLTGLTNIYNRNDESG